MKVLIVGGGGREHALAWKIAQSRQVERLWAAPGNDGMKAVANCVAITEDDHDALIAFAKKEAIDLTIIGPEQPLADGLVNKCQQAGLTVWGPTREAARIESSKAFAKDFMAAHHIPTAESATFSSYEAAKSYVAQKGAPIVLKADGLAAGKGVMVAMTLTEALSSLEEIMARGKFEASGSKVVIEEYLQGEEFSLMAFVHGEKVYPLAASQDHKRAYDGDQGPNTGGMGAYSPVPHLPENIMDQALHDILQPTASGLVQENRSFTGILYAGLMWTNDGPKVIEFNARFGDPEAQVILPRLKNDLCGVIMAMLSGEDVSLQWSDQAVVGVVLAASGYPGAYQKGVPIPGWERLAAETLVFHAATQQQGERWTATGGRILLTARMAATVEQAQEDAYRQIKAFDDDHFFYRHDIAAKALAQTSESLQK